MITVEEVDLGGNTRIDAGKAPTEAGDYSRHCLMSEESQSTPTATIKSDPSINFPGMKSGGVVGIAGRGKGRQRERLFAELEPDRGDAARAKGRFHSDE